MDIQYTTLMPGFCGKMGRCYNTKGCRNRNLCQIGFKVVLAKFNYYDNAAVPAEVKVHKQW